MAIGIIYTCTVKCPPISTKYFNSQLDVVLATNLYIYRAIHLIKAKDTIQTLGMQSSQQGLQSCFRSINHCCCPLNCWVETWHSSWYFFLSSPSKLLKFAFSVRRFSNSNKSSLVQRKPSGGGLQFYQNEKSATNIPGLNTILQFFKWQSSSSYSATRIAESNHCALSK